MRSQRSRKLTATLISHSASPQPDSYSPLPKYSGRIGVQEIGNNDALMVGCVAVGVSVPTWIVMRHSLGFMAVAILFVFVLTGFLIGMVCAGFFERLWRLIRGQPRLFSNLNALVIVNANGISIEGLGVIPWPEVTSCHGINDSDMSTIVYTHRYCQISLTERPSILEPIINHYLGSVEIGPALHSAGPL